MLYYFSGSTRLVFALFMFLETIKLSVLCWQKLIFCFVLFSCPVWTQRCSIILYHNSVVTEQM